MVTFSLYMREGLRVLKDKIEGKLASGASIPSILHQFIFPPQAQATSSSPYEKTVRTAHLSLQTNPMRPLIRSPVMAFEQLEEGDDFVIKVEMPDTPREKLRGWMSKVMSIRVIYVTVVLFFVLVSAAVTIPLSLTTQAKLTRELTKDIQRELSRQVINAANDTFTSVIRSVEEVTTFTNSAVNVSEPLAWGEQCTDRYRPFLQWSHARTVNLPYGLFYVMTFPNLNLCGAGSPPQGGGTFYIYTTVYPAPGTQVAVLPSNETFVNVTTPIANAYPVDVNRLGLSFKIAPCGQSSGWQFGSTIIGLRSYSGIYIRPTTVCIGGDVKYILFQAFEYSQLLLLLKQLVVNTKGYIMVVERATGAIVASTGTTAPFTPNADGSGNRNYATNCSETWAREAWNIASSDGEFLNEVNINGIDYFMSVSRFNTSDGIDWSVIQLAESEQFLGSIREYARLVTIVLSVVAALAVSISIISSALMMRSLVQVSDGLERVSRLNLNRNDMSTPMLWEVKNLYKSFTAMHAAISSFRKFVPSAVIYNILQSSVEVKPNLKNAKVTVMFQDIRDFTRLSETIDPVTLASIMGDYMQVMTKIIAEHGGTVDKFVGDCIMSVYNAPAPVQNHEEQACRAAIECSRALQFHNVQWRKTYGITLGHRIGIHTGTVLVGNIGSDVKLNWTVLGDNVNIASRLEGVNKYYDTEIIISEAVRSKVPNQLPYLSRKLATVRVSGRTQSTEIYELTTKTALEGGEYFEMYERALRLFEKLQFDDAFSLIERALLLEPQDVSGRKLRARIESAMDSNDPTSLLVEDLCK
ncbi:adenylate/guanylate cyclase with integral membrane sensor [Planoprotostelium fungivorum]|uniref:Adenylate/guanylate cyclase with integral membrane sensor n=1 Tax=Planoprotostelium fungivorum TaxID=1890364 RepID=A0A2P6MT74_9EUKA|nr:adenylate/guanylate cyclase with integral membrane sensor [Planoprotostelium fungivorum]